MLKKDTDKLFQDIAAAKEFIQNKIKLSLDTISSYETGGVPNHLSAEIARIDNARFNGVINVLSLCEQHLSIYLNPSPS